jgi:hypothetical protein
MNITINGVEYAPLKQSDDIRIVILQRGWVFVGRYSETEKECVLTNAKNYRYQGSKKGFGYVAANGPSSECKLDPCDLPVRFNPLTVIATIDCDGEKWKKELI